jgi:hypothetical protein
MDNIDSRKVLGVFADYCIQTNNAAVKFGERYYSYDSNKDGKKEKNIKYVSCGPESAAMGLYVSGKVKHVETCCGLTLDIPGVQLGDTIMMGFHNPSNEPMFTARRPMDFSIYPPNEVPQYYDVLLNKMLGLKESDSACKFQYGLTFETIQFHISNNRPMMLCGAFPCGGHYVLCVGYDNRKTINVVINDPYPKQWKDEKGYNIEFVFDRSTGTPILTSVKYPEIKVKLDNFLISF